MLDDPTLNVAENIPVVSAVYNNYFFCRSAKMLGFKYCFSRDRTDGGFDFGGCLFR